MPFPEKIREWTKRVQGNECAAIHYTESRGFYRCPDPIKQVHHLEPEGWVLSGNESFFDPNQSTPIGLCDPDHELKHPDLATTKQEYREGDHDAYQRMGHTHHELARQGVIYWNPETDQSMIEHVQEMQQRYVAEHPEDMKPHVKPHKLSERHHWTDIYVGTRSHPEDEGDT